MQWIHMILNIPVAIIEVKKKKYLRSHITRLAQQIQI